jgi:Fic family protein
MQASIPALTTTLDLLQQLNALRPLTAAQEQSIWQKFRLDWSYHSNNLEGNSLTYGETKSLLLHNITAQGKPLKDHLEITGHNEALLEISDAVKKQQPLTETFLRQLHTLILKERYQVNAQTADGHPTKKWVEVGRYKTQPNHVLTVTGETFRFAEPFEVSAKMQALIAQANQRVSTPAEGLLLAAKLHYEFVLIHPFDDGNGRMARILMNLILMQYGFPPAIIKTEAKDAYFAALRQADGGQIDAFIEYIANRVNESLELMLRGAQGENIEEPTDLDKKIFLLKGLIEESQGGKAAPLNTAQSVRDWLDRVAMPLVLEFISMNEKFKSFYLKNEFVINLNGVSISGSQFDVIDFLNRKEPQEISQLSIQSLFFGLQVIGLGYNDKNYDNILFMQAEPISYKVECSGFSLKSYRYDQSPSKTEIETLMKHLSEMHLKNIEDKRLKALST